MQRSGYVMYNGEEFPRESDVGKEAMKFEMDRYNPDLPQNRYPRMLYRAFTGKDGVVKADSGRTLPRHMFQSNEEYQAAISADENFNASCRLEVGRGPDGKALPIHICEEQHRRALEEGWSDTAGDAIARERNFQTVILGAAHAERQFRDKGMSEKAKAEAAAVDASTPFILAEIPEASRVSRRDVVMVEGKKIDKRSKAYREAKKAQEN